jgi:hypothetical protein
MTAHHGIAERWAIGRKVAEARADGATWKALEAEHGLSERHLRRLAAPHRREKTGHLPVSREMSDQDAGQTPRETQNLAAQHATA